MTNIEINDSERFCIFRCQDQCYGLPALDVRGVSPRPVIRPVPNSDPTLAGISHVQNEFIPVVSFRALSQVSYSSDAGADQQLLTLPGPSGAWSMLIDQVITLAPLEVSFSSFSCHNDRWSKVVVGSADHRGEVVQILDANALYQYAAGLLEEFWQTDLNEATHLVAAHLST